MPGKSKLANDETENYPSTQIRSVCFKYHLKQYRRILDLKNPVCKHFYALSLSPLTLKIVLED